jgi:hypothetical protein
MTAPLANRYRYHPLVADAIRTWWPPEIAPTAADFATRMRALQVDLLRIHLPTMARPDAARAVRTLVSLTQQMEAAA